MIRLLAAGLLAGMLVIGGGVGAWEWLVEPGRVYDVPIAKAHALLERTGLPPMVLGTEQRDFTVEAGDPSAIVWVITKHGSEMLRFVANLSAKSEHSTRVVVDVTGPTAGPFGNVAQRLANHKSIKHLYLVALEEQVAATLEDRDFNTVKLVQAGVAAAIGNIGELQALGERVAAGAQKRDRENIEKAYREEAAGR